VKVPHTGRQHGQTGYQQFLRASGKRFKDDADKYGPKLKKDAIFLLLVLSPSFAGLQALILG
jgi:hypothetical protein